MKRYDVVAFGEILIDFTFSGTNADGKNVYEENTGGAPANCVGALSKLGGTGAFIGMTGKDSFGEDVRKSLKDINVDIGGMRYSDSQHTTLAFVSLSASGERSFSFCRNPGADTQIEYKDIDEHYLKNTKVLHIGSLSLTDEPSKTTTFKMIEKVQKEGGIISYDPNWRSNLWNGRSDAIEQLKSIIPLSDIVKVSDEELSLFFGNVSFSEGAKIITDLGPKLVLITLGKDGVYYRYSYNEKSFEGKVDSPEIKAVDTTGAGDSFTGGLLYMLTRKADILNLTQEQLEKNLWYANCVAALCVTKRGGLPALPDKEEVEKLSGMKA